MMQVEWRTSMPGTWNGDGIFHAHDEDNHQVCCPVIGLDASHRPPTEAGPFCPDCMVIVLAKPTS